MTKRTVYPHIERTNAGALYVRVRRTLEQFILITFASSAIACSIDKQGLGFAVDPTSLLQDIETEYQTYNLSKVKPYDTVTIHARGVSGTGTTIDAPIVYGYDSRYVTVDANGRMEAVAPVSNTPVTVSMTFGGATRVDTVRVSVISSAPEQLRRLAIEPNPGDSAKVAGGGLNFRGTKSLRLVRESVGGTNMSAMLIALRSSDVATATIVQAGDNVTVTGVRPGRVMLYVSAYAYGIGMRDSLSFLVGWPLGGFVGSYDRYDRERKEQILDFAGGSFTVGMGSCIVWLNYDEAYDMDVVFDDSSNVLSADSAANEVLTICQTWSSQDTTRTGALSAGNISPWRRKRLPDGNLDALSQGRTRVFRKAGVYRYRSSLYGTTGVITVCDEKNDPTCAPENYQWGVIDP